MQTKCQPSADLFASGEAVACNPYKKCHFLDNQEIVPYLPHAGFLFFRDIPSGRSRKNRLEGFTGPRIAQHLRNTPLRTQNAAFVQTLCAQLQINGRTRGMGFATYNLKKIKKNTKKTKGILQSGR